MEKPLADDTYLLEKFPGKGGWTYARIPEVLQNKSNPFGWVRVKGSIDGVDFRNYHLMPMGNGQLFLPVKAAIRKIINKTAGATVHIILFPDHSPVEIPEEFRLCLEDEPGALENFRSYPDGEQKGFINWIYSARKEDTRIERMVKAIGKIVRKEKFYPSGNRKNRYD